MNKKIVAILGIIIGIGFIFAALYIYFFKGAPLHLLIISILFFGTGVLVEIITLTSKHEGWFVKRQELSKNQNIIMAICSLVFGICIFWTAIVSKVHTVLKVILFGGSLFFTIGSISLLFNKNRKLFKNNIAKKGAYINKGG